MQLRLVFTLVLCCCGQASLLLAQTASSRAPLPTPALKYFAGGQLASQPVAPRPHPIPPTQNPRTPSRKPFEHVERQPTLSPYLNLDVIESENGLPNYHAWVRPEVRQRRAHQQRLRQARRQQATGTARGTSVPDPASQNPQFLNMGSYFPSFVR